MNTISALEKDILLQVQNLSRFIPPPPLSEIKQMHSIFCGSGDSLAASMLAEAFSECRIKAIDPLDLLKNKSITKKNDVFIVSISGKTVSNIKVAKSARKSIALTSNPKSKLAKACDRIIQLNFPNSDVVTAGSISFLDSALTCISLVKSFRIKNSDKIFRDAVNQSKQVKLGKRIFFLGNLHTYPLALYGAAKIFEILGLNAFYERIEQFSHMELFSTKPGDTVIIFEKKNPHNTQLSKNLKKVGLNVIQPNPKYHDEISQTLFYIFFSQLVPLFLAKKKKQKECYFVTAKKLRKISDNMIY